MKKFLIIFCLLTFQFQLSWAAIDAYCQQAHEVAIKHDANFVQDVHLAASNNQDAPTIKTSSIDCSDCSFSTAAIMPSPVYVLPFSPGVAVQLAEPGIQLSTSCERPERPQWQFVLA